MGTRTLRMESAEIDILNSILTYLIYAGLIFWPLWVLKDWSGEKFMDFCKLIFQVCAMILGCMIVGGIAQRIEGVHSTRAYYKKYPEACRLRPDLMEMIK